jgi:hypothetical protein
MADESSETMPIGGDVDYRTKQHENDKEPKRAKSGTMPGSALETATPSHIVQTFGYAR